MRGGKLIFLLFALITVDSVYGLEDVEKLTVYQFANDDVKCSPDQYYIPPFNSTADCMGCPVGVGCIGGAGVLPLENYWPYQESATAIKAIYCPGRRCLDGGCSANRNQEAINPFCGTCLEGYAEWGNVCSANTSSTGLLVAFIITCIGYTFIFHFVSSSKEVIIPISRTHLYFVQLGLVITGLIDTNIYGTYVLDFLFNLNLLAVFPASPIALTPVQQLLVRFFFPLFMLASLLLIAILEVPVHLYRRHTLENPPSYPFYQYSRTFCNFLFFSFNSVVYAMWSGAKCTEYTSMGNVRHFNALVPALDCDTDYGKAVVKNVLYAGLPIICLVIIFSLIFLQVNDSRSRMGGESLASYCGGWFVVYENRRHLWEVIIFVRKLIIILFVVYLPNSAFTNKTEWIAVAVFEFINLLVDAFAGPYEKTADEDAPVDGPTANVVHGVMHVFLITMALYRYFVPFPYELWAGGPWTILAALLWAPTAVYICWRSIAGAKQFAKFYRRCGYNASGSYEAEELDD